MAFSNLEKALLLKLGIDVANIIINMRDRRCGRHSDNLDDLRDLYIHFYKNSTRTVLGGATIDNIYNEYLVN